MSEDEEDYMSANFVTEDVRPGLKMSHSSKRLHEMEKNRPKKVKLSELESSARESGLEKPLDSSNKGFALLTKMGYKPGTGLGPKSSSGGIKEPISVKIKDSRRGLGTVTKAKDVVKSSEADFRKRVKDQSRSRFVESDLRKSSKACFDLDLGSGKEIPEEPWFWPPMPDEKPLLDDDQEESEKEEEEEEEEPETNAEERLETLTNYLRTQYFYCIWCGDRFANAEEMGQICPGPNRESHDDD